MSQKALKKKELLNLQRQEREQYHQLYQQQQQQQQQHQPHSHIELFASKNSIDHTNLLATKHRFSSTPNINVVDPLSSSSLSSTMADNVKVTVDLYDTVDANDQLQQRGHSETDISKITDDKILVNAKSEFHLKSIASTQVPTVAGPRRDMDAQNQRKSGSYRQMPPRKKTAKSSVDGSRVSSVTSSNRSDVGSQMQGSQCGFADTDHIRVPIIGYEVMEERARFTVSANSL